MQCVDISFTQAKADVNYQFVHRQRYRHCSPGRRCREDFLQGTGRPPPDLHTQTIINKHRVREMKYMWK